MVMAIHADWFDTLRVAFVCLAAFSLTFTIVVVLFRSRGTYVPPPAEQQKLPTYLFFTGILIMFLGSAYEQLERIGNKTLSWRLPVFGAALVLISVALIIAATHDVRWAKEHNLSIFGLLDRKRKKGEGNAD